MCGESIGVITFDLSDLSLKFWKLTCHKGVALGHMLLFNINRKPYMGSPMTPSHFTMKGQSQGHSNFEALYLVKEQS